MGKHTQEPWKLYRNDQSVGDARGYAVCDVWPRGDDGMASEEGKANARRIVACVNACEGIDTDLLEKATGMFEANANLIAAAPELLAALEASLAAMEHMGNVLNEMDAVTEEDEVHYSAFEQAREAIAKAKGGAA